MKRTLRFLIRALIFVALLLGIDQALLHVSPDIPGIREVRNFYVDFRTRLMNLGGSEEDSSIETAIETAQKKDKQPVPPERENQSQSQPEASPRYVFADENGQLQFAESLEQIPPAYRQSAEHLDE